MSDERQMELLSADTTWFHVFRSMIQNGEVAKMGPMAFTVYCVIKGHTGINDGKAFPSIETISKESGVSVPQVSRELAKLENLGYLTREKDARKRGRAGTSNRYQLQEKLGIEDSSGQNQGVANWNYVPAGIMSAINDLKTALATGDIAGAKIVNIALTVNVQSGAGNQVNIGIATGQDVAKEQMDIIKKTVGLDSGERVIKK
jgi:hypothetical protein